MKNFLKILSTTLLLSFYACSDNCDGVECGPGVCDDGTCQCPDGYEGDACEIISNSVYYGEYSVVDATCGTTNNTTIIETITIAARPNGNPTEINLTAASSSITSTIDGTIINGEIEAEGTFSSFTLGVSGSFSDNDNFEATLSGAGLICTGVTFKK